MTINADQAATIMALISFADGESQMSETDALLALELAKAFDFLRKDNELLLAGAQKSLDYFKRKRSWTS